MRHFVQVTLPAGSLNGWTLESYRTLKNADALVLLRICVFKKLQTRFRFVQKFPHLTLYRQPWGIWDFPELSIIPKACYLSSHWGHYVNVFHSLWAGKRIYLSFLRPEASLRVVFFIVNLKKGQIGQLKMFNQFDLILWGNFYESAPFVN